MSGAFAVERRSIDFIPGSAINLFTLWFSANMQITTVVTGAFAVILSLPLLWAFINTTLYTGPLAARLGGADISWIVGLVAAAFLYYMLMRARVVPAGVSAGEVTGGE